MGRFIKDSASGRKQSGNFASDPFADTDGNLFYNSDEMPAYQAFSGYAESTGREEW